MVARNGSSTWRRETSGALLSGQNLSNEAYRVLTHAVTHDKIRMSMVADGLAEVKTQCQPNRNTT